jgi:DNA-binding transcriptional LysR family regulator
VLLALVPAALSRLAVEHPKLRVEITQQEDEPAFAALLAHDLDVVMGEEYPGEPRPAPPGVAEEDLVHDELRLAVPPAGPLSRTHLAGLAGAPWVLDPPTTYAGRWARLACRSAGFEPDVRFVSSDLLLHVHLVRTGHAVALLPDLLGPADGLRRVRLPDHPRRRLFTAVRRGTDAHPRVRAFRAALSPGGGRGRP